MQNDRKEIKDLTIAIVDDDPNAIKALADVLNRNFGITVAASATSAQSAIEITGKSKPDILFSTSSSTTNQQSTASLH